MDATGLRKVARTAGPFASVFLPTDSSWQSVRRQLATRRLDERTLAVLDAAVTSHGGGNRVLVTSGGRLLVDESSDWPPEGPIARVSSLPYLLPLAHRYATAGHEPDRSTYDQFVFEVGRPGGLAVDGLRACTAALREQNADALIVAIDRLGDERVWVGGDQRHLVSTDTALRGMGVPVVSQRADEALPAAALAVGAEVVVTGDPLPLADGVGVLLRHP